EAGVAQLVAHADLGATHLVRACDEILAQGLRRGPRDAHTVTLLAHEVEAEGPRVAARRGALPGGEELGRAARRGRERIDDRPAVAVERGEERRLVVEAAVDPHRVRARRIGELEGTDDEAVHAPRLAGRRTRLWYNRVVRLLVLDRYVVRELVSPFVFGGTLFTFFLLIDRIYHLTDLVITKGVPFYLVVQLLVFMLPSFMTHTLPMALLVAVLLAGGRLAGDLEIVAFKSAGVSPLRLFRPILLAGLVVTTTTALLTLVVNPLANREFQRQLFQILQTRAVSGLQERLFNATFGDVIIY